MSFGSLVTTQVDPTIFFDWGSAIPSGTALTDPDTYSVRWTGWVEAPTTGTYSFITLSDDGVRLWVDDTLVIDNWTDHGLQEDSANVNLVEGELVSIRLEYYENGGDAFMGLIWNDPDNNWLPIPTEYLYPPETTLPDGGSVPDAGTEPTDAGTPPDTTPPTWPEGRRLSVSDVAATSLVLSWPAATDDQGVTGYVVYEDDVFVARTGALVRTYTRSGLTRGQMATYRVEAEDAAPNESTDGPSATAATLPPDPSTVAPPLSTTGVVSFKDATSFLYSGTNPVQFGVQSGTHVERRLAVLRGKVTSRTGTALQGVRVSVLQQPEVGFTLTREDGRFDLAVNGGGALVLSYEKEGFLPSQREVEAPWGQYREAPEVTLVALDSRVTTIVLDGTSTDTQVAQGNPVTDSDGTRQATVLFPPGTQVSVIIPGVGTRTLDSLSVRATEYTVGDSGPSAMPGTLPAATGYTYAVELGADEATAVGASRIQFDRPVAFYVDNFLDFPSGDAVPIGFYDRTTGRWEAEQNGRVIAIVGVTGGVAQVDIDGDGTAEGDPALLALGITLDEREQLGTLYASGKTLWRVALTHFTPWDCNWPYGPPLGARAPDHQRPKPEDPEERPECQSGSIIECQNQTLGETLPVTGTPYQLVYRSDRMPGRRASHTMRIPLTGAALPPNVIRVVVELEVAGRKFRASYAPLPNLTHEWAWDGKDAYGRTVSGSQVVVGRTGFVYSLIYQEPANFNRSFAAISGVPYSAARDTREMTLWQYWSTPVTPSRALLQPVAGWSFDLHHQYDPDSRTLYMGDGTRRSADNVDGVLIALAGTGVQGEGADGTPALQAALSYPADLSAGSDGRIYIADYGNHRIVRIDPDGVLREHHRRGSSFTPVSLKVAPNGNVYVADYESHRVWSIDRYGNAAVYAGTGIYGNAGDGGRAVNAELAYPVDVDVAPDGTLYIVDKNNHRVRRVSPDGFITSVPGTYLYPESVALAPDGSIYVVDSSGLHRLSPHGELTFITEVMGCCDFEETRVEALPDGSVLVMDRVNRNLFRLYPDGTLSTIAQGGGCANPLYTPASEAQFCLSRVAPAPDGTTLVVDYGSHRVRRLIPVLPARAPEILVASEDGAEFYVFDAHGRHLRTVDTLTQSTLRTFTYDTDGRLTGLQDRNGQLTTIDRDTAGVPTAIVAPHGHTTLLDVDANGYLSSVQNPASELVTLGYTTDGLLTTMTDARLGEHAFTYDTAGRLTRDDRASGSWKTLTRTATSTGFEVTLSTPLGRQTRYQVLKPATGKQQTRVTTTPSGSASTTLVKTSGEEVHTLANGTMVTVRRGPDPRFGMQAPLVSQRTVTTPGGLTSTTSHTRAVAFAPGGTSLDLASLTDTHTVNGRAFTSHYDASTREWLMTSPLGKTVRVRMDAQGRVIRREVTGLDPVTYGYDTLGRLTSTQQGSRIGTSTYNLLGQVASTTDAAGGTALFSYGTTGHLVSSEFPGSRLVGFSSDAHGNLTSITPPGRPAHVFTYTLADAMGIYTPPSVTGGGLPTVYGHDADEATTSVNLPDGTSVTYGYDTGGRLTTTTAPGIARTLSYLTGSGQVDRMTNSGGSNLSFVHDGALLKGVTWDGVVAGRVSYTYNADFQVTAMAINTSGGTTDYRYDGDGLLSGAGALDLTRNSTNGLLTGTTLGTLTTTHGYNTLGEGQSLSATAGSTALYSHTITGRDGLGRITDKTETVQGVTKSFHYTYDVAGRLETVSINGVLSATYGYDSNGNRTLVTEAGVTRNATYDAQDRLLTSGGTSFVFGPNGDLQESLRTGDSNPTEYTYDSLGALRAVTRNDGTQVDYVVDALGRRVGRKVNGTLTQGFLYDGGLRVAAELDGSGALVSRFVYATRSHVPDFMVKGGVTYRIISDHLGSPRLVVNTATGVVAQRMDYDAWGRITTDTAPGFQPFGFAGGLHDALTGLTRFGARDYDAETGRWTNKDPIRFEGGDTNLYAYAANDPVNLIDPSGLDWSDWQDWDLAAAGDFAAAFGSTLSFGLTNFLNDFTGASAFVNKCSGMYNAGEWAGLGLSLAFGGAHLGRNAAYNGFKRLFHDPRTWGSVRSAWSRAAGGLRNKGQSLHHWLIPQRVGQVNAGFNYMPLTAKFNSWMNNSTALRNGVEWGFRGVVAGIYGAPATAALNDP